MPHVAATSNFEWEPFRCEVIPERDAVRVKPFGEIDIATAEQVIRPLRELVAAGFHQLSLDLSEVTFIDSTGIRVVLEARQLADEQRVSLKLLPGSPTVQRAFELTGLAQKLFP